ncbi:MAG: hypothetical protein H8D26_06665 [Methanomicrobia archaeon]|nr:hypothetical protein [Methanomicrobia archaeon]
MEPINIRLPEVKIQKINEIATRNGITRSEVIRHALTIYFQLLENLGGFIDLRSLKISPNGISTSKWGDLIIMKLKNGQAFVLANTSSGGIVPKHEDEIKLDGKLFGRLMARTVLIKVLSSGALPIALIANLSVEFFPTGSRIFQGIREEVLKIKTMEVLEGHTEENIKTKQTGIGITVLGVGSEKELKIGKSLKNDLIVAVGEPKVGYEVIDALNANARDIIMVEDVLKLSKMAYVHEIIPVGHEGIKGGLKMMENIGGYRYKMETGIEEGLKVDIEKSAGPSTAIILTLEEENIEEVKRRIKKPFQVLGRIL